MRAKSIIALAAAAVASAALPLPAAQAAAPFESYVALGDSYSALGDLTSLTGAPGCTRTTKNYPTLLQARIAAKKFTDATCGEAETRHMTGPQSIPGGSVPPQFDALTAETDLVTVTIGINDLDFGTLVGTCAGVSLLGPGGNLCEQTIGTQEKSTRSQRLAEAGAQVGAVIDAIRLRSPKATIAYVSYLNMLPDGGSCATMPMITPADMKYLHDYQQAISAAFLAVASERGAVPVDATAAVGHDVCQPANVRWVEPLIPATTTSPFHPNPAGTAAMAATAAKALGY